METKVFEMGDIDIAWCSGCGNFGILAILKQALAENENVEPVDKPKNSGLIVLAVMANFPADTVTL